MGTESTGEKKPLRIKNQDAPRDFEVIGDRAPAESTTPQFQPAKTKAGFRWSEFNWSGYLIPVAILALIVAGGWYGFRRLDDLERRVRTAETEAAEAESEHTAVRRLIPEIQTKIQDIDKRQKDLLEHAESDARAKAAEEARPEIENLKEAAAKSRFEAGQSRPKTMEETADPNAGLKARVAALRAKVNEAYDANVELKTYLNSHNGTLHPPYSITPRP